MDFAKIKNRASVGIFALCAFVCAFCVIMICVFLLFNAIPTIKTIGFGEFIFGDIWQPLNEVFGILPMIVGSIYVSAFAIALAAPLGILSAIYLAYFSPKKLTGFLTPCIEILAGIPSIVYGFFGLLIIVPFSAELFGTSGKGLFSASILLAIMILPTIILISKFSLEAVDNSILEAAIALGVSKERAVFFIIARNAKSGIFSSVILALCRAIGEAMAVIVIAGNQTLIPQALSDGVRTLTTNIVLELGYAQGLHRDALISSGVVLFVFILGLNLCLNFIKKDKN